MGPRHLRLSVFKVKSQQGRRQEKTPGWVLRCPALFRVGIEQGEKLDASELDVDVHVGQATRRGDQDEVADLEDFRLADWRPRDELGGAKLHHVAAGREHQAQEAGVDAFEGSDIARRAWVVAVVVDHGPLARRERLGDDPVVGQSRRSANRREGGHQCQQSEHLAKRDHLSSFPAVLNRRVDGIGGQTSPQQEYSHLGLLYITINTIKKQ
jgi:hypothetical protein